MEKMEAGPVTAFDSLFTTNRIQMLKILFSRIPPAQQGLFAVYIKFLELQYTFSLLRRHPGARLSDGKQFTSDFLSGDSSDTIALLDELLPYSGPAERSKIENMKNMLQNMSRLKEMMDMMDMMKEMFPEGFGGDDPMNILSGMTGMSGADMSAVFDMLRPDGS